MDKKDCMSADMLEFQRKHLYKSVILYILWLGGDFFIWLSMFSPWGRYRALWEPYVTAPFCLFLAVMGIFICHIAVQ
ncbi:MAG: hypothetical protein WCQ72_07495, partial [Eubacteriales bacterium]